MTERTGAPTSHYFTYRCQHYDKGIEFDVSDFEKGESAQFL
jgi:hypothetical protein